MNVRAVRERDWDNNGKIVHVTDVILEDGREAPGYDLPQIPEVGKPLPQGWSFETGKSGKSYVKFPKERGNAPAAFRNTKEGQAVEQERMDRRTALMQAVEMAQAGLAIDPIQKADEFYTWLRQTAGGVAPPSATSPASTSAPSPAATDVRSAEATRAVSAGVSVQANTSRTNSGSTPAVGAGQRAVGAGNGEDPASAADCLHLHTTDDKPEGGKYKLGWAWCLDCRTPVKVAK